MKPLFEENNPVSVVGKRYKLINQLGVGGFGQSFLAQDLHLPGTPLCVVKRLFTKTNDPKQLKVARRLFDTEARVLYQLGKHDQIPLLYAHFEENKEFYLVQEFIEGEPLTRQILKGKPWAEERAIALIHDILEVLVFVHQQNVIHRDIKPSNLMRRQKDGKLVLIDFGAVKQVSVQIADPDSEIVDSTISVGTHGYISNEQLAGKPRFCSDVYAVGIVGIQALTGVFPRQLPEDPVTGELDWRAHVPTVGIELAEVIDRMVYYDFRDRYPTAVEALAALKKVPSPQTDPTLNSTQDLDGIGLGAMESFQSFQSQSDSSENEPLQTDTVIFNPANPATPAPSAHHDETLLFAADNPLASTFQQPRNQRKLAWLRLKPQVAKLLQSSRMQGWTIPVAGVAIAGVALVSFRLGGWQTPSNPALSAHPLATDAIVLPPISATKFTPPSAQQEAATLLSQADQLRKQRQYQSAIARYDQVIKRQPSMAEAYWGRCESLNGLKQFAQAVVACNDALNLQPDYAAALWSKGKALKQQDQLLAALTLFEQATALKSDFAEAWIDRGSTLQEVGRSVEAIEALDQAIALNRNSAVAWSIRGSALWNLGRFDQAIASLDKALQIEPTAVDARALRQQAKAQLGY